MEKFYKRHNPVPSRRQTERGEKEGKFRIKTDFKEVYYPNAKCEPYLDLNSSKPTIKPCFNREVQSKCKMTLKGWELFWKPPGGGGEREDRVQ